MKKLLITIFIFCIFGNSFAQNIPDLPLPLGAGTAETWNNEIYFFGGSDDWAGSTLYQTIYKFDGTTWTLHDSIPDDNVWDVESVLVGDETFLISGWPNGASFLRKYDMNTGNWTSLAPSSNIESWGITAEYLDGFIYLFDQNGNSYKYEIATDTWTTVTQNNATGTADLSSILYQDEIYVLGFSDSTFYKYTPATDSWLQLANSPYQVGACAMGIINELIYCIGGNINGNTEADYKSIIVYDITTDVWEVDSLEISNKRHWMATAEYLGGLYVLGGIDSLSNAVSTVEEIVPQGTQVSIKENNFIPLNFELKQNYPNPFNPTTTINYELQIANYEFATLTIFNVLGKKVKEFVLTEPKGSVIWNGTDEIGNSVSSGNYFYKITANGFKKTKQMTLLK